MTLSGKHTHCLYCELPFSNGGKFDIVGERIPTRDHFIPLSKGGNNRSENIFIVCSYCNTLKGNFLPPEFIYWLRCKIEWKESPKVGSITYNAELLQTVKKNVKDIYNKKTTQTPIVTTHKKKSEKIKKESIVGSYLRRHKDEAADVSLSVNNNTIRFPEKTEHQLYLQHQTYEQFLLAEKHGWKIAKLLTDPEPNFHCAD